MRTCWIAAMTMICAPAALAETQKCEVGVLTVENDIAAQKLTTQSTVRPIDYSPIFNDCERGSVVTFNGASEDAAPEVCDFGKTIYTSPSGQISCVVK